MTSSTEYPDTRPVSIQPPPPSSQPLNAAFFKKIYFLNGVRYWNKLYSPTVENKFYY